MPTSACERTLDVRELSAGYGPVPVLRDVEFSVGRGEIVALLGPNGAGKTTLLRAVTGEVRLDRGSVIIAGVPVQNLPPHRRARLGMATVPEGRALVPDLPVRSNLVLGSAPWNRRWQSPQVDALLEDMYERFPVLGQRSHHPAGLLSGGEQQMLAIARALMARPSLLVLDEPSLGLAPRIVGQVFAELATIAATGTAVLIAEQNATAALRVATHSYLMENGSVAAVNNPAVDGDLRDAFLGHQKGTPQ